MGHRLISPLGFYTSAGLREDRGCVSCGFVCALDDSPPEKEKTFLGDGRGRYWCLDCAAETLAHVRRRNDERGEYDYPWRFEDTGGLNGQHIRSLRPKSLLDEMMTSLAAKPSIVPNVELSQEFVNAVLSNDNEELSQEQSAARRSVVGSGPNVLHILSQDDQPYGSIRQCCNHCGVMLSPTSVPTYTTNWNIWRYYSFNCSKVT